MKSWASSIAINDGQFQPVVPAQAGTHASGSCSAWIPASAGMTALLGFAGILVSSYIDAPAEGLGVFLLHQEMSMTPMAVGRDPGNVAQI